MRSATEVKNGDEMEESNREKIQALGMHNPVIHRVMTMARYGQCTYTEALEIAVLCLCESQSHLQKELVKKLEREPVRFLYFPQEETSA